MKQMTTLILVVLVLAFAATTAVFYQKFTALKANPQKVAQEESKALIARVGQLYLLPEGEDPTVATVNDPEKLKDQPFFAKAQKGDKVLIYTKAKQAILYRPGDNKIVAVAPLNIGNPQQSAPAAPSAPSALAPH